MAQSRTDLPGVTQRLSADERGTTVIEYALIAALIAVAIIGGMTALGNSNGGSWNKSADKISSTMD